MFHFWGRDVDANAERLPTSMSSGVYGITAWPPKALESFILETQAHFGVSSYGEPHFNLRYPFIWAGLEEDLIERFALLSSLPKFEAKLRGWQDFPNALYLSVDASAGVLEAHQQVLAVGGEPLLAGLDAAGFVPHLTVALNPPEKKREKLFAAISKLEVPIKRWKVSSLALTRDDDGHLLELARCKLA
jgi:2'-5' RNA ligase